MIHFAAKNPSARGCVQDTPQVVVTSTACGGRLAAVERLNRRRNSQAPLVVAPAGSQEPIMTVAEISSAGLRRKVKDEVLQSLPFLSLEENDKDAAKKVLERRAKLSQRWKADHSSFTALCLDVCKTKKMASMEMKINPRSTQQAATVVFAVPAEGPKVAKVQVPKKQVSSFSTAPWQQGLTSVLVSTEAILEDWSRHVAPAAVVKRNVSTGGGVGRTSCN
eukprot:Skav222603  [mRNA]  locus=scaffold5038:102360:110247:+ [translate_table: standard]